MSEVQEETVAVVKEETGEEELYSFLTTYIMVYHCHQWPRWHGHGENDV